MKNRDYMRLIALFILCFTYSANVIGGEFKFEINVKQDIPLVRLNDNSYDVNNGKVNITLEITKAQYAMLYVGGYNQIIYMEPSSDLKLTYDSRDPIYGGKLKNENSLINSRQYKYDINDLEGSVKYNIKLIEAIGNSKFFEIEKKRITFMTQCTIVRTPDFNSAIVSDSSFKKYCCNIIDGDEDLIEVPDYISKVISMIKRMNEYSFEGIDRNHIDQIALNIKYLQTIKDVIYPNSPRVAQAVTKIIGLDYIRGYKANETFNNLYHQIVKDESAKAEYISYYNMWQKVKTGENMPDLSGVDLNGKIVKISDFKGKVIYLDLWYSGCGPCRKEICEGAPILHDQYKHCEDLVFVYGSVDRKESAWREAVQKDGAKGVHILLNSPENKVMLEQLIVKSYPRYIIVDNEGRIVDVQAPRPSNAKTKDIIEIALKKNH